MKTIFFFIFTSKVLYLALFGTRKWPELEGGGGGGLESLNVTATIVPYLGGNLGPVLIDNL